MNALRSLILFFLLTLLASVKGQSDLLFNNFNINSIAHNPAAIENNGLVNCYLGAHQQWIGFQDAPNMQWVHVSTFFDRQNMGVSLNVSNQSEGVALTQNIKLGYAYHVLFKGGHQLSLGLGAGVYFRRIDYSKLHFAEEEQGIPVSTENILRPDFDFGFEYHYHQLTAGAVATHITVANKNASLAKIPIQNHFYIRYSLDAGKEITLVPGLGYFASGKISTLSLEADMEYRKLFQVGVSYRTQQSLIIRAGILLSEVWEIKYAYDLGAGSFATYHTGIHEFVVVARFARRNSALNSPRFIDN
jgi:type IX secretion system PorP/SprF family membrane protein